MTTQLERYLRPRGPAVRLYWGGLLLMLVLAAGLFWQARESARQAKKINEENLIAASSRAPVSRPKQRPIEAELQKRWGELKADREFPWSHVFRAVERADRGNIELLEFRPDKRNRRVIFRGEAHDRDALTAYLQELAVQPTFANVHILRMQSITRDGLVTFGFEIKATIR